MTKRWLFLFLILVPAAAWADTAGMQAAMDTVWVVTAGALVFFMQAGFALLESGMSRSKNAVNVVMKNFMAPAKLLAQLQELSESEGVSESEIIRTALEQYVTDAVKPR